MTIQEWLDLARSCDVKTKITEDTAQEDFQAIIQVAARRQTLDWEEAVALLHMVYGWMPTMLRPIKPHDADMRNRLLAHLQKVKAGELLTKDELEEVRDFANVSIVGASKLLHVLCPSNYVIWDSRVARSFLWEGVSRGAYATIDRYMEYLDLLRQWVKNQNVIDECAVLRGLNQYLALASDLRLMELVLYLTPDRSAQSVRQGTGRSE